MGTSAMRVPFSKHFNRALSPLSLLPYRGSFTGVEKRNQDIYASCYPSLLGLLCSWTFFWLLRQVLHTHYSFRAALLPPSLWLASGCCRTHSLSPITEWKQLVLSYWKKILLGVESSFWTFCRDFFLRKGHVCMGSRWKNSHFPRLTAYEEARTVGCHTPRTQIQNLGSFQTTPPSVFLGFHVFRLLENAEHPGGDYKTFDLKAPCKNSQDGLLNISFTHGMFWTFSKVGVSFCKISA